ncbi:MAG: ATP-binding protein [Bacteroidia bacterium]
MKFYLLLILLVSTLLSSCGNKLAEQENQIHSTDNDSSSFLLNKAATLMDSSALQEAQFLLLSMSEKSKLTDREKYYVNAFLAEIMYYSALSDQGISYSIKAKSLAKKLNNKAFEGSAENFLGLFFLSKEFPDSSIKHFKRALNQIPDSDTTVWISKQFNIYNNLGEAYLSQNKTDSTEYYSYKAIAICQRDSNPRGYSLAWWNLAEASLINSDYELALERIEIGINGVLNSIIDDDVELFLLGSKLKALAGLNNTEELYLNLRFAEDKYSEKSVSLNSKIQFLESAINSLTKIKNYEKAIQLEIKLKELQKQLNTEENLLRVSVLNNYYRNEQKLLLANEESEKQNANLKSTRNLNITLTALFLTSIIVIILFKFNSKQKNRIQQLAFDVEKKEILKNQEVNEFKAQLNAIQEERNRLAKELHDDIGSSISSINIFSSLAVENFDKNPKKSIELILKIKKQALLISENLSDLIWAIYSKNDTYGNMILKMKNFCYEILSEKNIKPEFTFEPHLQFYQTDMEIKKNLLQFFKEAINNIAKYSNASIVEISISEKEGNIEFIINDNGIGFQQNVNSEGNGLSSLRTRAKSMGGHVEINSSTGNGTKIKLEFPHKVIATTA